MAFCTTCGATVQGAFCQQCGAQVSAAGTPGAAASAPTAAPLAVAPAKRGISPLVWILIGVAGIFVLCIVGLIGAFLYVAKNPGLAIAKLVTAPIRT